MTKPCILIFSSSVLALTVYSSQNQSGYINSFIEPNAIFAGMRVAIIICLLAYTFIPSVRTFFASYVVSAMGILLAVFGFATLVSPTLFGSLTEFFSFGDSVILLEAGILARLISLELPSYAPQTMKSNVVRYDASLAAFQAQFAGPVTSPKKTPAFGTAKLFSR